MTRIAVIADIHGNVPALEAVLDDLATQNVDEVLVGGDLVGRGPQGSRVVRRIRELGLESIGGNHEDYLSTFRRGEVPPEWREAEEWAASRWMAAELGRDDAAYIAELPFAITRPGLRLVHGTPRSNREGIGAWTAENELAAHLDEVPEPVLVCAHTHRALVIETEDRLVVNVGSVGLPFNRDPRAQYAIFTRDDTHASRWAVELRQVVYDLEKIFAIYESSGFLAHGGITARLLRLELELASPVLVPFLDWARARGVPAETSQMAAFFAVYRPGESLRLFYERLRAGV